MCPSAERLVDLVAGRLDAPAERAIEEHIDTCASCRVALAAVIRETHRSKTWQLGRYRIDAQLGVGGMGIVYHAWDPALSRELAIKVVRSPDAELRTRLAREAQSMARVNHRNVCQIYDVGTEADELWIAMELVPGTTLRAWISEARRDPAEVLRLLADAARGLAAAHAVGLVHRDVKPENILVDRNGRAVVSDFGLARDDSQTRITHKSALAGTPAYMAPEQINGAVANARSDQYAFAIMAHEALVGAKPRPRNRASTALPPRIRAALGRALSEDPGARFATLTELMEAMLPRTGPSRWRTVAIAAAAASAASAGVGAAWFATRRTGPGVVRQMTPVVVDAAIDAAPVIVDAGVDAGIVDAAAARAAPPIENPGAVTAAPVFAASFDLSPQRFTITAPSCFARAGDCAAASRGVKERDVRRDGHGTRTWCTARIAKAGEVIEKLGGTLPDATRVRTLLASHARDCHATAGHDP